MTSSAIMKAGDVDQVRGLVVGIRFQHGAPTGGGQLVETFPLGIMLLKDRRGIGLVTGEQRGRFVHYRLSDPRLDDLLVLVEGLLRETACGVDRCESYG